MAVKRRTLLINRPVQLGLLIRLVLHWFTFLATVMIVLPLFRAAITGEFFTAPTELASRALTDAVIVSVLFLLLLPYFVFDIFRTTNRFAGPMYRLQLAIRKVGRGSTSQSLKFRDGDLWHDVATDFNEMLERLRQGDQEIDDVESVEPETVTA
jgi:methyl-accepting chemotaxis protein